MRRDLRTCCLTPSAFQIISTPHNHRHLHHECNQGNDEEDCSSDICYFFTYWQNFWIQNVKPQNIETARRDLRCRAERIILRWRFGNASFHEEYADGDDDVDMSDSSSLNLRLLIFRLVIVLNWILEQWKDCLVKLKKLVWWQWTTLGGQCLSRFYLSSSFVWSWWTWNVGWWYNSDPLVLRLRQRRLQLWSLFRNFSDLTSEET